MVITAGNRVWQAAHGRSLQLQGRGHIMAILNATPDSFSDGGRYGSVEAAVGHALACVEQGASIIDIGGESTRPGATPVSAAEEQERVLPVIEQLCRKTDVLISIDTVNASTAAMAIAAGAHIVNDVNGLQADSEMAATVARTGAGVCIMHTSRGRQTLPDIVDDQFAFLEPSLQLAQKAGIARDAIVLDPGFGFGKEFDGDVALMARFSELRRFGYPLLAGTSRKRFIGRMTGRDVATERDIGTAATTAILRLAGAVIFRVHDVAANRDALAVADAILAASA